MRKMKRIALLTAMGAAACGAARACLKADSRNPHAPLGDCVFQMRSRLIGRRREKAGREGRHVPYGPYEAVMKRPLDVLAGGVALVLLSPVMAVIAALVKRKLGSPVVFVQDRPGRNERIFSIYKFRTMTDARGADGRLLPDEARLTGFGKVLRSTSLDELPELVNIIKGDMSFVGPRPLLPAYLPFYTERERRRHDVLPGLTGYAQVHGRNALGWEQRLEMDARYVERITFAGDLKIMLETVLKVLERDGISSAASATMESFIEYAKNRRNEAAD